MHLLDILPKSKRFLSQLHNWSVDKQHCPVNAFVHSRRFFPFHCLMTILSFRKTSNDRNAIIFKKCDRNTKVPNVVSRQKHCSNHFSAGGDNSMSNQNSQSKLSRQCVMCTQRLNTIKFFTFFEIFRWQIYHTYELAMVVPQDTKSSKYSRLVLTPRACSLVSRRTGTCSLETTKYAKVPKIAHGSIRIFYLGSAQNCKLSTQVYLFLLS